MSIFFGIMDCILYFFNLLDPQTAFLLPILVLFMSCASLISYFYSCYLYGRYFIITSDSIIKYNYYNKEISRYNFSDIEYISIRNFLIYEPNVLSKKIEEKFILIALKNAKPIYNDRYYTYLHKKDVFAIMYDEKLWTLLSQLRIKVVLESE